MPQVLTVLATALTLLPVLAADARAQLLLAVDGVELHGTVRRIMPGAGTCNVLETDTSYEAKKANHGAPMDVWRLDFSVRNGSGRWLDHLIARYEVESKWPDCTNWSGPDDTRFRELNSDVPLHELTVGWSGTIGSIQESGRNVVQPGQTLTTTEFVIVLSGDAEPRFSNWSTDFDFAAAPPPPGTGAPAAAPAATPEQETVFWQSIVGSENPAMFEAYLAQFPNGVFRALAEARLAELRASSEGHPGNTPSSASAASPTAGTDAGETSAGPASGVPVDQLCTPRPDGVSCWMELSDRPRCYVWNPNPQPGETVTWTAECAGGQVQGTGTLRWVSAGHWQTNTTRMVDGKPDGHTVIRDRDGWVAEGPYVNGKRDGDWVLRLADGTVEEQLYTDGERVR